MGLYLPHAGISPHIGLSHEGGSSIAEICTYPSLVGRALSGLRIELHYTVLLLARARWHRPSHSIHLCRQVFVHPLGPYWYLHTLILCGIGYFVIWQQKGCNTISRLILLGFYLAGLSFVQLVAWDVSLYFLLGIIIRQSKLTFLQVFRPSGWHSLPSYG